MILMLDLYDSRHTYRNRIVWHIRDNNSVRANLNIIAYPDIAKHFGSRTYIDIVANMRRSWFIQILESNHDAISNSAIIAKTGISAHYNSAKVVNYEFFTDFGLAGQFDTGNNLDEFIKYLVYQ
jgi:hypothetical protein